MRSENALRKLADITAYQWGMVTSAQASTHGITRLDLSRLATDGQLERLAHGIYKDAGAPSSPHEDLQAAWLSTDPGTMGETRLKHRMDGVVVASETAATLHGIGDFRAARHEFVSPVRRQTQRTAIRYRQRVLDPRDVTLVHGLPVMTMERTIADLVDDVRDLSLVADALRDASDQRVLDLARLRELLAPLAARTGFKKDDGDALLNSLLEIAGIDPSAVAHRIASDPMLASRITEAYVASLSEADLDRILTTPELRQSLQAMQESFASLVRSAMTPQLIAATTDALTSARISAAVDQIARAGSAQLVGSGVMRDFSEAWTKSLARAVSIEPETLSIIREAQKAVARG